MVENHPTRKGPVAVKTDKKKGGKFQPFKKLFGKRKKKDPSLFWAQSVGKRSYSHQSVSNGTFSSDEETLEDNLSNSWARISSLGSGHPMPFP